MIYNPAFSRRSAVAGLGAALLTTGKLRPAIAATDDWMTDPHKILDIYVRMQSDLSGKVAPWRFGGPIAAIIRDKPVSVLFIAEGAETKKLFVRENGYELWSKVMTMFKDPETGEVLNGKEWRNPFTGETNMVQPNVIGSVTQLYVSESGKVMEERSINGRPATPVELKLDFLVLGDKVEIETHRFPERERPAETTVLDTNTAELAHILDVKRPRIEATFSGTDIVPWQSFMEMPPGLGHAVWHTTGKKMHSFDELSPEYLEQAKIHIPDVLAWADL